MISAEEARKQTSYSTSHNKNLANMLHVIELKIKEACNNGLDRIYIDFVENKYIEQRYNVCCKLTELGYKCDFSIINYCNEIMVSFCISW